MNRREYYSGDPDTIYKVDEYGMNENSIYNYVDSECISFVYYQTSVTGEKEFMVERNMGHYEMAEAAAIKLAGRAVSHLSDDEIASVRFDVYNFGAYKGRIFLTPKVITTWYRVSPKTLTDLLSKVGSIDEFKDYYYIIPHCYDGEFKNKKNPEDVCVLLMDYLNNSNEADSKAEIRYMETNVLDSVEDDIREKIIKYNAPSSDSWAANKEREGWKTIAQRNNTIYQENKNIMKNNKYQKEFSNYLQIMNEALEKNDFAVYDAAKEMLEETVEDCKNEKNLLKEMNTTNFGVLNHIFEEALPNLIKSNKKAVKNVIKTIKEDKNLMAEFNFYNIIKNYNSKVSSMISPDDVVMKLSEQVLSKINYSEVKKSNDKLRKVMAESGIIPLSHVDKENMRLYESGNKILSSKPNLSNIYTLYESKNGLVEYMNSHKDDKVNETLSPDQLIENFENKLKENLTESEISFVQQITDWKSPIAEQRKEKLFNKFKNECINKINDMLKEDSENVELKNLSTQINEMKFNKESIVSDIAKLLEIRDILMDD